MTKIEMIDGKLSVPNNPEIPYINGDGVGIDISPAMIEVVNAAVAKSYAGDKKLFGRSCSRVKKLLRQRVIIYQKRL
jgi:isocitrate dehydrogenase (NADP) (EC 1.1.1.42)